MSFDIQMFKHLKKILFIYLFLEKGERREEERKRNGNVWLLLTHPQLRTWPAAQACALTGNRKGDPSVLRPALNPLSHTSQGTCFKFWWSLVYQFFNFVAYDFCVISKKSLLNPMSWNLSPMFSKSFIILALTLRSLIHLN